MDMFKEVTLLRLLVMDMMRLQDLTIGFVLTHGTLLGEKTDSSKLPLENVELMMMFGLVLLN